MMKPPNDFRLRDGLYGTSDSDGNNGAFVIPINAHEALCIIASDGMEWEHVSVHVMPRNKRTEPPFAFQFIPDERTPTWMEMCQVKDLFWDDEDTVVQFHPPKSQYVNMHKHTLHLWRPMTYTIVTPPRTLV